MIHTQGALSGARISVYALIDMKELTCTVGVLVTPTMIILMLREYDDVNSRYY
jgi:hypothetical protein